jgi:phosphoribosylaminoimidazolecarboxamide formyltransferase/IMP cyclohydrolase
MEAIAAHDIGPIDMVVVNLYDFKGKPSIEEIDIGGPSLLRAAAKNHLHTIVVVDPSDYDDIAREIETNTITRTRRQHLAGKVFRATEQYDKMIADYFEACKENGFDVVIGGHATKN